MILVSLALLLSGPVHEKTDFDMNHENCAKHDNENAEGGDAREEADDQTQPAQEFRQNNERGHRCGHAHFSELYDSLAKGVSAEPTERKLCPVSRENDIEGDSQYECRPPAVRLKQCFRRVVWLST